ncbi:4-hydroxyproline epimerase [Buttiauxella sp. B2]|uniref:4-hydroxyproline epimerase n=1 Tax=Buttiauxella sp. B2 TaxID=2587812 RepID=UPI00112445BD|nr:4-hydroxyproline epimerase [Buttiauxella sp. B2]TNV19525.1 4-hydroxyproline epimerase [Buttiauxella sp. B2]
MQRISIIDSHTGGEPTRLVIDGFPDLGNGSMKERREILAREYDHYRRACILEPRGNDVLVGALLCTPVDPSASAGVIFFNNAGYLGMCGHGTIGLVRSLAYMRKISPGTHKLETPVGDVTAILHEDYSVSVRNVPSWRYKKAVVLESPNLGRITGDIVWGGNWFFLVNDHGLTISRENISRLSEFTVEIQRELQRQAIFAENDELIDHIELFSSDDSADSRSFVMCPGGAYDRSPCGTGTSAKLACLAADGKLPAHKIWRQASVIGSVFEAHYEPLEKGIQPVIRGSASVCAETTLLIDKEDPFAWGVT